MKKILLVFLLWIGSLNIYPQYNVDQPMSLIEVNGVSIAYTIKGINVQSNVNLPLRRLR